jgi:hypothetical protein
MSSCASHILKAAPLRAPALSELVSATQSGWRVDLRPDADIKPAGPGTVPVPLRARRQLTQLNVHAAVPERPAVLPPTPPAAPQPAPAQALPSPILPRPSGRSAHRARGRPTDPVGCSPSSQHADPAPDTCRRRWGRALWGLHGPRVCTVPAVVWRIRGARPHRGRGAVAPWSRRLQLPRQGYLSRAR